MTVTLIEPVTMQELFITAKYVERRFLQRSLAPPGGSPQAALWDAVLVGDVRHAPMTSPCLIRFDPGAGASAGTFVRRAPWLV